MKSIAVVLGLMFTLSGWTSTKVISVKDRLRYELWYEGITPQQKLTKVRRQLPEELARPLRKL